MAKYGIFVFSLFVSIKKIIIKKNNNYKKIRESACPNRQKRQEEFKKTTTLNCCPLEVLKILSVSLINTAISDYRKHLDLSVVPNLGSIEPMGFDGSISGVQQSQ